MIKSTDQQNPIHDARVEQAIADEREKFSKECQRFHDEGRKCITCGRCDKDEIERAVNEAVAGMREAITDHCLIRPQPTDSYKCTCGEMFHSVYLEGAVKLWGEHIRSLPSSVADLGMARIRLEAAIACIERIDKTFREHPLRATITLGHVASLELMHLQRELADLRKGRTGIPLLGESRQNRAAADLGVARIRLEEAQAWAEADTSFGQGFRLYEWQRQRIADLERQAKELEAKK